jgi:hypothetical protein
MKVAVYCGSRAGFLWQQYIDMLIQAGQPGALHRASRDPEEKWV